MANAKISSRDKEAQKGQKPYFTDFTMAPSNEMSLALRKSYANRRHNITLRRQLVRLDAINGGPKPVKVRGGFPKDRVQADDHFSQRGNPNHKFTDCYKMVDKVVTVAGELVHTTKIYVLHATRGWKVFA